MANLNTGLLSLIVVAAGLGVLVTLGFLDGVLADKLIDFLLFGGGAATGAAIVAKGKTPPAV